MAFDVEGTAAVVKRREKCKIEKVRVGFSDLLALLRDNPYFVVPDKASIWRKAFPKIPNHRHADLPEGWRVSWTVMRDGERAKVLVVFLGTHKEYETTYGFTKH